VENFGLLVFTGSCTGNTIWKWVVFGFHVYGGPRGLPHPDPPTRIAKLINGYPSEITCKSCFSS